MRLRTILLILTLMAGLSSAAGGFYYLFTVQEQELAATRRRAVQTADRLKNQLQSFLTENHKTVKALAGLSELREALLSKQPPALTRANHILDHFQQSLEVNVCYLMDHEGEAIASSNRFDPDSFVGENFSFRPYFRQAIAGSPGRYLALGTTSKKRGAYHSYPVYGSGSEVPVGVVVIKSAIRVLERNTLDATEGISLLTGPFDVIFASSRPEWRFGTLWEKTQRQLAEVAESRQFGSGPWPWVGLRRVGANLAENKGGDRYLVYVRELEDYPKWRVVHLVGVGSLGAAALTPLARTTGIAVIFLCIFAGLAAYFLNRKARLEIARREAAESDLRRSEERYRFLYHKTPALLHSIDTDARVTSVSDYWTEALGYTAEEVVGRRITEFMTPDSRKRAETQNLPALLERGSLKDVAYQFVKKHGEAADVLLSATVERDADGSIKHSLSVLTDVSALKRTEEMLRRAQEQLSQYSKDLERQVRQRTREIAGFMENTPAVVYLKDPEGRYILVNSRWEELFGLSNQQVQGKTVYDVFSREAADVFRQNDLKVLASKLPLQAEELFPLDGRMCNYLSVRFPVLDGSGRVSRLCGISVDITDLKNAQERLRRLSGDIMNRQEQERTAIARELHDELGQVLTALRMDAVWLRGRLRGVDAKAERRAEQMCELIDKTISDVRHIATRLRPPALDDLGLVDALEWYTDDYEQRTGVACVFTHDKPPPVSGLTAIAAFRVAQEALTNVARHSGASGVELKLFTENGHLELSVGDNGQGFDPASESKTLGITGMRERAALAGGELDIESRPGGGCRVSLKLPLPDPGGETP